MTEVSARDRLAVDGGVPVRTRRLPGVCDPEGRTLGDEEIRALERVVGSARLSRNCGPETPSLERDFARLHDIQFAIATSSGTAALHLAVAAVDPEPGDEIITASITDFGTVAPILAQNAVPVFADVDPATGILDVESVERCISARTRALVVVHLFGAAGPVSRLRELADRRGLILIEDCAQAYIAETPDGRYVGTVGHIGCFSLQQSKHITCGDGGLVLTDDAELARRMRLFADKGWPREGDLRTHLFLGLNYRMTELQAAVARAQLPKLRGVVDRRRRTAARIIDGVGTLPGITLPAAQDRHSFWLFPLVVDPDRAGGDNARWAAALTAEGVPTTPGYIQAPVYRYPALAQRRTYGRSGYPLATPPARPEALQALDDPVCPNAERLITTTLLTLPCNEGWTDRDADDVAYAIRKVHDWLTAPPLQPAPWRGGKEDNHDDKR